MSDNNTLEDWQLALLVESRRLNDPAVVEAAQANALMKYDGEIDTLQEVDDPVVVERSVKQSHELNESLREEAEGIDDPTVVSAEDREEQLEAVEAVKELLADALKEQHGLRDGVVDRMDALSMVDQFRDEEDGDLKIESMSQQPETGGSPDDDPDGDGVDSLEDVSTSDKAEAKDKLETADRMEDRTPDFAESLRAEAADILGVEPDSDVLSVEVL